MTLAQVWREACAAVVDEDRAPMHVLAATIARKHATTLREMRGRRQTRNIADARLEFYARASVELGKTNGKIGQFVGGREPSTVWCGIRSFVRRVGAWGVA